MTEIEEIIPLIEYDIEEGNHISWYHAKVLLEHIASLITTIESEQLKLMQAHTYTAQLFSKQMKETKRLNAQIESQKEEIAELKNKLFLSNEDLLISRNTERERRKDIESLKAITELAVKGLEKISRIANMREHDDFDIEEIRKISEIEIERLSHE